MAVDKCPISVVQSRKVHLPKYFRIISKRRILLPWFITLSESLFTASHYRSTILSRFIVAMNGFQDKDVSPTTDQKQQQVFGISFA